MITEETKRKIALEREECMVQSVVNMIQREHIRSPNDDMRDFTFMHISNGLYTIKVDRKGIRPMDIVPIYLADDLELYKTTVHVKHTDDSLITFEPTDLALFQELHQSGRLAGAKLRPFLKPNE